MATNVYAVQATLGAPRLAVSAAITEADNGDTVQAVELPAGSWVPPYGVTLYVAEVFAGGTPSMTIGDGDATAGWAASSEITEATVGCYTSVAGAYATTGKYYGTADTIDVVVADTTLTGGTAYLLVTYYDLSDVDLTAS